SRSEHGVLRGLHFQHPHPQGKLVQVLEGEVFDVALDVRQGSPTFGEWEGFALSAANHHQLYIPPGFAHGFCVTSPLALFFYKCTDLYHPECESTILWDDPALSISWPVEISAVSQKDREGVRLGDMDPSLFPRY
ncbi:MAG: dTDP-4-dehydrorhamnose 3,5-epimerase, partial [bacterium]